MQFPVIRQGLALTPKISSVSTCYAFKCIQFCGSLAYDSCLHLPQNFLLPPDHSVLPHLWFLFLFYYYYFFINLWCRKGEQPKKERWVTCRPVLARSPTLLMNYFGAAMQLYRTGGQHEVNLKNELKISIPIYCLYKQTSFLMVVGSLPPSHLVYFLKKIIWSLIFLGVSNIVSLSWPTLMLRK